MTPQFKLKNPNISLVNYGLVLTGLNLFAVLIHKYEIIIGLGVIVRLLAFIWIPKAAIIVGRKKWPWTLLSIITPVTGMMSLGAVGYRKNMFFFRISREFAAAFESKRNELQLLADAGKTSRHEMDQELFKYENELQEEAQKQILVYYDDISYDEKLTENLKKKGYLPDENSDTYVESGPNCPACGTFIPTNASQCPDCGLVFRNVE